MPDEILPFNGEQGLFFCRKCGTTADLAGLSEACVEEWFTIHQDVVHGAVV